MTDRELRDVLRTLRLHHTEDFKVMDPQIQEMRLTAFLCLDHGFREPNESDAAASAGIDNLREYGEG